MNRFNIRIELLNGANGDDYAALHQRMEASEFSTIILADDKTQWKLPPAEYVHVSTGTAQTVRDLAQAVASKGLRSGLGLRVYVVIFVDWASSGLDRQ